MRVKILFLVGMLVGAFSVNAQTVISYPERLGAVVEECGVYQLLSGEGRLALRMDFANSTILNPEDIRTVPGGSRIFEVDLVFTRYPLNLQGWEVNYDTLLNRRFQELEALSPGIFQQENIRWRILIQTGCTSQKQARECFHGFVIRYGTISSLKLQENFKLVRRYLNQEAEMLDSTTFRVLERHPEWRGMAIAADWTSSMYANGVMLAQWIRARLDSGRVEGLLFFTDGDSLQDSLKIPGMVGGLHYVPQLSWYDILRTMEEATLGGHGGDQAENDLEGLLKAQELWPEAQELILIADNKSAVRDMVLLPEIRKPVRIVACGSTNGYIHPHYLAIAAWTGGTLHILNEDIVGLDKMVNGNTIQIGYFVYRRDGDVFTRLGRIDDPSVLWEK